MNLSLEKQRFFTVGLLLSWCSLLVFYRLHLEFDGISRGLLWNLFLALLPLIWSGAFQKALAREQLIMAALFGLLWLLFLPNAPYILTDLVHLPPRSHPHFWLVLTMLLSCAGTGVLLGNMSLINVQHAVQKRYGLLLGWMVTACALLMCGGGIYVGRFLRWNSWDAVRHPFGIARSILHQFIDSSPHPHPVPFTLVWSCGLLIGYLALRVASQSAKAEVISD